MLNNNLIKKLNENITNLKNLVSLDLSYNMIEEVKALAQIKSLKYLFLKNNKVIKQL